MLKSHLQKYAQLLTALLLFFVFGAVLLIYARPMKDVTLDLSLIDKSADATQENSGEKGWEVYTQEGEAITHLEPDGKGFYSGIELGQTFYLSRTLAEDMDDPTLQIGTADRTFVVWLDNEVIYTDWPELDAHKGELRLPMNDHSRQDPISITLPQNYIGKTLTIAQSSPEWSEGSAVKAAPASVVLYCGYAYESGIIAESYSLAITAAALFAVGLVFLAVFLRRRDWSLLCIALTAFFAMSILLNGSSFRYRYFGTGYNYHWYLRWFAALALMTFLTLKAGKRRKSLQILLCVCAAYTPVSALLYVHYHSNILPGPALLFYTVPETLFLLSLAAALILGMRYWRRESRFYRVFAPLTLGFLVLYWLLLLLLKDGTALSLYAGLSSGSTYQLYRGCLIVSMASALVTALWDALKNELEHHMEKRLLEERREMAQVSYDSMCRQHEEVMKLRHDMAGHLETLRGMSNQGEVSAFIDELIGKNRQIRPIVHTGNEVLDIILGSKLSAAIDAGISVDIVRSSAPEKLPISGADLSSVMINILNNAIAAAQKSGAEKPWLKLDIHVKGSWLAIVCENASGSGHIQKKAKKETMPKHGLGLKIIEETVLRYQGLFNTEYGKDHYKLSIIIPLDQSLI